MYTSLALCTTLVLVLLSCSHAKKHFPLYVFGDSLYDTGTGLYGKKGPSAEFWPYGMTYFKNPAGRFSDGRLIPDFIAEYANISFPEPYLRMGFDDYVAAVNFASAAAGVLVDTRPNTINLKLQMNYFAEMESKMEQKHGKAKTKTLLARAVYLFNIGGNDYVELYKLNNKTLPESLKTQRYNYVLGNLTTHITTIYNKGGRKFAFQNIAPLGCLPAQLQADGNCTKELNDVSQMHNDGFKELARSLNRKLVGFKYSIYDFYTSLSARLANGSTYGFKESQSACCGSGPYNGVFSCQKKGFFTVCSNPSDYLWFDAGHPTEKADQQFAQEFWSGSIQVVAPRNLKSLFGIR